MAMGMNLLQHAIELLSMAIDGGKCPPEVYLRRATSASYYALFHEINDGAVSLLAPNVPPSTNHRIQRWFDHGEMKKICGRFTASPLSQPLLDLIGPLASPDCQTVARSFVALQEARHNSDYDLSFKLTHKEAARHAKMALEAIEAWDRIQGSAEANVFILSLLMFKNWERDRI
jgi:uncharacterized protein (UPF0332 family)